MQLVLFLKSKWSVLTVKFYIYGIYGIASMWHSRGAPCMILNIKIYKLHVTSEMGVVAATGEPALTLAVAVTHALHQTILEARKEFGYADEHWLHIGELRRALYTINYIAQYHQSRNLIHRLGLLLKMTQVWANLWYYIFMFPLIINGNNS